MIPCIVDKQMRHMLNEFADGIRITQTLRPSEAEWLSNGLVEIFGGCYYNFPRKRSEFSMVERKAEMESDIAYSQWISNKAHIMDFDKDGVDGEELSAGLSLLVATYNEIRNKNLEGKYTFFLSSDMGSFEDNGERLFYPNCVIRFYREYGESMVDLSLENLNRDDTLGFITFQVGPDDRQPINAIEQIDGQWFLTYREDA